MSRRDLIGTKDLPTETLVHLIDRSDHYYELLLSAAPFPKSDVLQGRTVANLFFESSTRTRTSFELAERRLGADFISFTPAASSLTKGESLLDTVRVLEAMKLDVVVVRHSSSGVPEFLASNLPKHVHLVNAGDGAHEHPTQALLDAAQLRRHLGDLKGKRIAIVGDIRHSRVARSNIWLLQKLGATVSLVGPDTLMPRYAAEVFGVQVTHDLDDLLSEIDAMIVLRIQHERQASGFFPSIDEYHSLYGITTRRLGGRDLLVLHPGPINLGVELDTETAYGEHSLVLSQVKRGVAVRMAVLEWLFAD